MRASLPGGSSTSRCWTASTTRFCSSIMRSASTTRRLRSTSTTWARTGWRSHINVVEGEPATHPAGARGRQCLVHRGAAAGPVRILRAGLVRHHGQHRQVFEVAVVGRPGAFAFVLPEPRVPEVRVDSAQISLSPDREGIYVTGPHQRRSPFRGARGVPVRHLHRAAVGTDFVADHPGGRVLLQFPARRSRAARLKARLGRGRAIPSPRSTRSPTSTKRPAR